MVKISWVNAILAQKVAIIMQRYLIPVFISLFMSIAFTRDNIERLPAKYNQKQSITFHLHRDLRFGKKFGAKIADYFFLSRLWQIILHIPTEYIFSNTFSAVVCIFNQNFRNKCQVIVTILWYRSLSYNK